MQRAALLMAKEIIAILRTRSWGRVGMGMGALADLLCERWASTRVSWVGWGPAHSPEPSIAWEPPGRSEPRPRWAIAGRPMAGAAWRCPAAPRCGEAAHSRGRGMRAAEGHLFLAKLKSNKFKIPRHEWVLFLSSQVHIGDDVCSVRSSFPCLARWVVRAPVVPGSARGQSRQGRHPIAGTPTPSPRELRSRGEYSHYKLTQPRRGWERVCARSPPSPHVV